MEERLHRVGARRHVGTPADGAALDPGVHHDHRLGPPVFDVDPEDLLPARAVAHLEPGLAGARILGEDDEQTAVEQARGAGRAFDHDDHRRALDGSAVAPGRQCGHGGGGEEHAGA